MTGVTISLRSNQSTPLTSQQVDANFQNLADAATFTQAGSGAAQRPLQDKGRERVSVADYLDPNITSPTPSQYVAAIRAGIASGARRLFVSRDCPVNAGFTLAANQIIDFDGGSFIATADIVAPNGILYANNQANIKLIDPVLDASATAGLAGVNLINCPRSEVVGGRFSKCNLNFQSTNNTVRMGYKATGTVIDLAGFLVTSVYVSGAKAVLLLGIEMANGREGLGIYNGATLVREIGCESYGHTQDGSVIINGNKIVQLGNLHHDNGQSGITTQRPSAATDCQDVSIIGNITANNAFDGQDLRGATTTPWGVDMRMTVVGNVSVDNVGTGYYSVNAEGVVHVGNVGSGNGQPALLMNKSARNIVIGMYAGSNANLTVAGTGKAGIVFQDSPNGTLAASISSNSNGATQQYGVSFTGTSADCSVAGGYYQNNTTGPMYLGASNTAAYVTGAAMQTVNNVWTHGVVAHTGAFIESGWGIPSHIRTKGSTFQRTDGGNGELYVSNGTATWTMV